MENNEQDYDPMAAFRSAAQLQNGLPQPEQEEQEEVEELGELEAEERVEGETQQTPQGSQKTSTKIRAIGAKVVVEKGNQLQSDLFVTLYDWRSEKGYLQAKADLHQLMNAVQGGKALNEKEQALLKYAREYIEKHEERRAQYEHSSKFSPDDMELMQEVIDEWMKDAGAQLPPGLLLLLIVSSVMINNFMQAFNSHPQYNPPV